VVCRVTIQYVVELDLIDNNFIRFIVLTSIAPRYSPSLDPLKSSDRRRAEYVQNTLYSMHIFLKANNVRFHINHSRNFLR